MSYDYNFPESLRIAEINNNRKVGTRDRRFIQSGNNVASGFARAEPYPLGSPAMGGMAMSGGGAGKKLKAIKHGLKQSVTDPVGFTKVLVGPPVTSSNFKGDPSDPFGGKVNVGRALKKVGSKAVKVAAPIVTKAATKALEKALTDMMKSSAEEEAMGAGIVGGKKGFKAFAKKVVSSPATKAMTQEAMKIVIPIAKDVAKKMMKEAIQSMMEGGDEAPAGGKVRIGRALKKVGKDVATGVATNVIADALMNPAVDSAILDGTIMGAEVAAEGAGRYSNAIRSVTTKVPRGRGRPRKMARSMSMSGGIDTGGAMLPYGAHPMRQVGGLALGSNPATYTPRAVQRAVVGVKSGGASRQAIVKKIMKERGVSLPQASSIVKSEGLY
jgi:chemotaxis receptor (MCP) glutamine deamidase CheD